MNLRPQLLPLPFLVLGGCSSPRPASEPGAPTGAERVAESGQPTREPGAYEAIASIEDRRHGAQRLGPFLSSDDARVRARAARALGRMPLGEGSDGVDEALSAALDDRAPQVRAEAAFAIGMRADDAAAEALRAHWDERDPRVRARVVEAASKLADEALWERVLEALADPALEVRIEAAVAPHRWPTEGPFAERVDVELVAVATSDEDPEVVWRALFSLQRRRADAARSAFLASSTPDNPVRARLFAVKGLARLSSKITGDAEALDESDERFLTACREALELCLQDEDARVAQEAASGLVGQRDASQLEHPSFHVRAAVIASLASSATPRASPWWSRRLGLVLEVLAAAGAADQPPVPARQHGAAVAEAVAAQGLGLQFGPRLAPDRDAIVVAHALDQGAGDEVALDLRLLHHQGVQDGIQGAPGEITELHLRHEQQAACPFSGAPQAPEAACDPGVPGLGRELPC